MKFVRSLPQAALLACLCSGLAYCQAVPAATAASPYEGFSLPTIGGSLRYSLTASETFVAGYNGAPGTGSNAYTNLSGSLAYLSRSETHPFSAVYAGGYLIGSSQFPSYPYQTLSLSQVAKTKNWSFVLADSVSYLPQTPATGLSGIPGAGDIPVPPVQVGPQTGLGILTVYASRVTNAISGTASRRLTGSTSIAGTGTYLIQRYTGNTANGINNDEEGGTGSINHRINARSSFGGSYTFSNSSFSFLQSSGGVASGYQTQSLQGYYTRQLTRRFGLNIGAGPQWLNRGDGQLLSNSSVNVSANSALNYTGETYNTSLSYTRGINNGNGVVVGTRNDLVALAAQRRLGRIYNISGLVGYNRSVQLENSLLPAFNSSGVVAGGQFSAQIRRPLTAFASYSLQRQSFDGTSQALNAFNGLSQYISFGVTYSPKALFTRK